MGIIERREREKEQRREAIIDAAEKVFFSRGVGVATMDDVAEEAELSKGTLYLYFKSKEDLIFGIAKRALEILTDMFATAAKTGKRGIDQVHGIGKAYSEFSKKHHDYFDVMTRSEAYFKDFNHDYPYARACQIQGQKALEILARSLKKGIADGTIRSDIAPMKTAIILWGQSMGILQLISSRDKHFHEIFTRFGFQSTEEIIDHSFTLIRYSLQKKPKGGQK